MKSNKHLRRDGETNPAFEEVVRAMSRTPGVTQAKMFGCEGLKFKGRFFAVMVRSRLAVKLPESAVQEVIARKQGKQFYHIYDPNRIMKEWVSLEPIVNNWLELAREAKYFVAQIKTKSEIRNRGKK